jgi:hypothetical protein
MAKSKKSRPAPAPRPRIVVGVPGAWRDGAQVQELLATRHRLLFAGEASVLVNLDDPDAPDPLVLETYPRDPTLRRAFERSSGGAIEEALLARIEAHTLTLYLVDEEGGALDSAARLLTTAVKLLDVGGLAVKVETAGLSHPPGRWRELAARADDPLALYRAFVVRLFDPTTRTAGSVGMHALGLPDVTTTAGVADEAVAMAALDRFQESVLVDRPTLRPGDGFALPGGPRWTLALGADGRHGPEHLFRNPFGLWTLNPA